MIDYSDAENVSDERAYGFPILPKDAYLMRVAKVTLEHTKKGHVRPKAELRVEEGQATGIENNGMPFFASFLIGTESDPEFEDPQPPDLQTWQAKNRDGWKRFVLKCGAGLKGATSLETVVDRITGCKLWVSVGQREEKAHTDEQGNKYDARTVNVITGVRSVSEGAPATRSNGQAGAPRMVPRQPTGFQIHEDE